MLVDSVMYALSPKPPKRTMYSPVKGKRSLSKKANVGDEVTTVARFGSDVVKASSEPSSNPE